MLIGCRGVGQTIITANAAHFAAGYILAMRTFALRVLAVALCCAACYSGARGAASERLSPDTARILQDVAYLASDALEGRGTGTAGNDSAAAYIARRFRALGLSAPQAGFIQSFQARPAMGAQHGLASALPTQNVVAIIRGRDSQLRGQYVVLGAHFDHLGRSATFGALDPEVKDAIRNGADDNASGTAGIMELARLLGANPPRRSVVVVAFSGEELGILGSSHFVADPPAPLVMDSVQAMLNFDMIGRLRNDRLLVFGTGTAQEWPALISAANGTTQFTLALVPDGFGPSDHSAFYARNIPVLHFFSDTHEDYHRATDDAARVNAPGIARIVLLAERIAREVGDRDARLTFTPTVASSTPRNSPERSGPQPYLGSVPDMAAAERPGLRLTGVTPGSPADRAGLKAGDIVVSLGGVQVVDLTSYSNALYARKPGDEVDIVVMRGTERVTLHVTLGRRGQ